jgi:hypothetical protein
MINTTSTRTTLPSPTQLFPVVICDVLRTHVQLAALLPLTAFSITPSTLHFHLHYLHAALTRTNGRNLDTFQKIMPRRAWGSIR